MKFKKKLKTFLQKNFFDHKDAGFFKDNPYMDPFKQNFHSMKQVIEV